LSWKIREDVSTGKAFIYVDETTGENSIVIVGQANTHFDSLTELSEEFKKAIDDNDIVLLQK
jgi:sugar/nucleoside kinase (ribokinase family)